MNNEQLTNLDLAISEASKATRNPIHHTYADLRIDLDNQIAELKKSVADFRRLADDCELKYRILEDISNQMRKCERLA